MNDAMGNTRGTKREVRNKPAIIRDNMVQELLREGHLTPGGTVEAAFDARRTGAGDDFLLASGVSWEGFVHAQGRLGGRHVL